MPINLFELLIKHIQNRVTISTEQITIMLPYFRVKHIKKKQLIIRPGSVTTHRNYIAEGAFQAYVTGNQGEDLTIQFAIEDCWIYDSDSYIYQRPAGTFISALEDSLILQIDYASEQKLKSFSHKFETFFRIMVERAAADHQRRLIVNLTQTIEERYDDFINKYPLMVQRIPHSNLASYLGTTTEFLAKICNNKTAKKR